MKLIPKCTQRVRRTQRWLAKMSDGTRFAKCGNKGAGYTKLGSPRCKKHLDDLTLTPKQRVLKRWPEAVSWAWADCVEIYTKRYNTPPDGNRTLGRGTTATQAWDEAARNL